MLVYVDNKLDAFFDKNSNSYMDGKIWSEIFTYLDEIKETKPKEYLYELKRCRDLKNSFDTAYQDGLNELRNRRMDIKNFKGITPPNRVGG